MKITHLPKSTWWQNINRKCIENTFQDVYHQISNENVFSGFYCNDHQFCFQVSSFICYESKINWHHSGNRSRKDLKPAMQSCKRIFWGAANGLVNCRNWEVCYYLERPGFLCFVRLLLKSFFKTKQPTCTARKKKHSKSNDTIKLEIEVIHQPFYKIAGDHWIHALKYALNFFTEIINNSTMSTLICP